MLACNRRSSLLTALVASSALIVLLCLHGSAVAEPNPATGKDGLRQMLPGPLPPPQVGATEVLWDITHGVKFGYEPGGAYAPFVGVLSGLGYNFSTTAGGIDNIDLSSYDILVICAGSSTMSPYTPNERAAAQAFVQTGGSILILGDNANAWPENVNPLAQGFGITVGLNRIEPLGLFFSNFLDHPVFTGIDEIYFVAGGGLGVVAPAIPIAWTNDGADITIAALDGLCGY